MIHFLVHPSFRLLGMRVSVGFTLQSKTMLRGVLALLLAATAQARSWKPIDGADLVATESSSSPGADLEFLFVRYTMYASNAANFYAQERGERGSRWIEHHVRAKIFTQKGCNESSILKFSYDPYYRLRDLAARVVKPDGTEIELSKSEIFETTAYKKGGIQERVVSFAFPNLAPGDVVEYSYERALASHDYSYLAFDCQKEAPVREFTFSVESADSDWNAMWYHLEDR